MAIAKQYKKSWWPRHPMTLSTCQLAQVSCVWWCFKVKSMSHAAWEAWRPGGLTTHDRRPQEL